MKLSTDIRLFQHQREGVKFVVENQGKAALFWDMGTGKTLTGLEIFQSLRRSALQKFQLLVVCPISLIENAWAEDIQKYTSLTFENLRKSQNLTADVLLINYEAMISKKFQPTLQRLINLRPMCILDECHKIKSYNAKITKTLLAASRAFPYKVIMSATPAPNSETEYWSQMCFIDPQIFGDNFFRFRNKYVVMRRGTTYLPLDGLSKQDMVKMMQRGYTMVINPNYDGEFKRRMRPRCQYVRKNDVLDLPDEIDVNRFVDMTAPQKKAYKEMWDDLVTEIKGTEVSVPNALAKIMKVRQITGGFLYVSNEDDCLEIEKNPKIDELREVVEEIGNKKIIIFCQYRWEVQKIVSLYPDRAKALYGESRDKDDVVAWFKGDGDRILVSHPASGGVGLSFNDCDYMVFYSLSYSFMEYYQSRGRIMRANKKNNATYIHLIARNSIDEVIMSALNYKENNHELFQRIMK